MHPPFIRAAAVALTLAAPLTLAMRPAPAQAMVVPINHAERLNLGGTAASVIIGNAAIVSVTVVDSHTVYVMGKGPGTTNVTVLNRAGQPIFASEMTVAAVGSNVTLYRGDKRVTVNCAYGCIEAADGSAAAQVSAGPPAMTAPGALPTKLMP
jgi:Flp pilus assembly secretin CpaC